MTLRTKLLLSAALGLGSCLGSVAVSRAQHQPNRYYIVPNNQCPTPVYPSHPVQVVPGHPAMPSQPAMPSTTAPSTTAPSTTAPSTTAPSTTAPSTTAPSTTAPSTAPQAAQPGADAAAAPSTAGMDAGSALAAGGDGGSSASGGGGHLGRADQNNRLNLFDTQAAIPQNRVWFSVQRVDEYKTGLAPVTAPHSFLAGTVKSSLKSNGLSASLIERQEETLYRLGAEVKLNCNMSISVQGQYLTFDGDDTGSSDTFTNPQILLKYALINDGCRAVSATLGYQPDIDTGRLEFNDNCHAVYPGLLFYQETGARCFMQGGCQFRIPLEDNNIYTFDFALSFGYWLWRHESCGGYGHGYGHGDCMGCKKPLITGIVPQIEFFGKEVIGDDTITDPFGIDPIDYSGTFFNPFVYREPRHVYDVTVGAKVMLHNNSSIAAAVSYPLTGANVRQAEYFVTLNFGF